MAAVDTALSTCVLAEKSASAVEPTARASDIQQGQRVDTREQRRDSATESKTASELIHVPVLLPTTELSEEYHRSHQTPVSACSPREAAEIEARTTAEQFTAEDLNGLEPRPQPCRPPGLYYLIK